LQYARSQLEKFAVKDPILLGFDIKAVTISLPHTFTYKQDITDRVGVEKILHNHHLEQVDCIICDMAPNTI
jgi:23S rRNA U2552 (ribose-2'-O)-methylase RlmE/FtsJ